jgi:hypothetical protein
LKLSVSSQQSSCNHACEKFKLKLKLKTWTLWGLSAFPSLFFLFFISEKHFNFVSKFSQHFDIMCIMLECGGAEVHIEQQKKKHTIKVGRNISTEKKKKSCRIQGKKTLWTCKKLFTPFCIFNSCKIINFTTQPKVSERVSEKVQARFSLWLWQNKHEFLACLTELFRTFWWVFCSITQ